MTTFWPNYGLYDDTPTVDDDTVSVAEQVLDAYSIQYNGTGGGPLGGIDLKHLPSLQAISMSLAEATAKGGDIKELIIDAYGIGEFITIGSRTMNSNDLYYSVPGESFNYTTTNVIITGQEPPPVRTTRQPYDLLSEATIWDDSSFAGDQAGCYTTTFKEHAVITFPDPHTEGSVYGDGIESIYDPATPWEEVITWIWDIDPGDIPAEATISYANGAEIPIKLAGEATGDWKLANANMGTLYSRVSVAHTFGPTIGNPLCKNNLSDDPITCDDTSISIDLPDELRYQSIRGTLIDNYQAVTKVWLIGWDIAKYWSAPISDYAARNELPNERNSQIHVNLSDPTVKMHELRRGEEFAVGYEDGTLCIRFADNSPQGDLAIYGAGTSYRINPNSAFYPNSDSGTEVGCIFPLLDNTAFLVEQVFVQVALSKTPSFAIYDPTGNAIDIATDLRASISAVTMTREPAPVAINGILIDQADGIDDNDPTTVQDKTHTAMELAVLALDSGPSINIEIATLTPDETEYLSSELMTMIEEDEGISANHVFGPYGTPEIGDTGPNGGIINSVTYSYSDSGSYTISASEGPRLLNNTLTGVGGGPHIKTTETLGTSGIVIQDEGNNVTFKVMVDRYGPVYAYNATSSFIRIGDRVQVDIKNIPVEV